MKEKELLNKLISMIEDKKKKAESNMVAFGDVADDLERIFSYEVEICNDILQSYNDLKNEYGI